MGCGGSKSESSGWVPTLPKGKRTWANYQKAAVCNYQPPKEGDPGHSLYKKVEARLPEFKTGDFIGFEMYPADKIHLEGVRAVVKMLSDSRYTHAGMIIVLQRNGKPWPCVVEATVNAHHSPDAITGAPQKGKRRGFWVFDLAERVETLSSVFVHIPLKKPLTKKEEKIVMDFTMERYILDSEFDSTQMTTAGLDQLGLNVTEENLDQIFCSEFVGAALKKAGLLSDDYNPSVNAPGNVARLDVYEQSEDKHYMLKDFDEYVRICEKGDGN